MIEGQQLTQAQSALGELEDVLLTAMWDAAQVSDWGPTGMGFNLRFFEPLPRELVRGALRTLRDKGAVVHMLGLWSEEGEPRGSGYALTEKTAAEFRKMEEEARADSGEQGWRCPSCGIDSGELISMGHLASCPNGEGIWKGDR